MNMFGLALKKGLDVMIRLRMLGTLTQKKMVWFKTISVVLPKALMLCGLALRNPG